MKTAAREGPPHLVVDVQVRSCVTECLNDFTQQSYRTVFKAPTLLRILPYHALPFPNHQPAKVSTLNNAQRSSSENTHPSRRAMSSRTDYSRSRIFSYLPEVPAPINDGRGPRERSRALRTRASRHRVLARLVASFPQSLLAHGSVLRSAAEFLLFLHGDDRCSLARLVVSDGPRLSRT